MAKLGLGYGRLVGIAALSLMGAFIACSSNEDGSTLDDDDDTSTGARSGSGGGSVTGGASGDTGGTGTGNTSSGGRSGSGGSGNTGNRPSGGYGNVDACPGLPANDTTGLAGAANADCVGSDFEPERRYVDMFIMLDRSVSMIEHTVEVNGVEVTRWQAVTAAVEQFVNDPAAADIRMGLGIFSYTGTENQAVECDPENYAVPKVEIGSPDVVGAEIVQYIKDLETNVQLGGFTPTAGALEGAIMHAKDWAAANPTRKTVVVLVTDGMPTQCTLDVAEIAAIAGEGQSSDPRIATYVVGVQGAWNLAQIAQQGGTEAFVVGETGDAAAQFVDALINITDSPINCEYQIPPPASGDLLVDYDMVSMVYTPTSSGETEEIPKANGLGDCANSQYGGWYYDDEAAASDDDLNTNPSKILVCPCTCARFGVGRMSLKIGCEPRFVLY